MGMVWTLAPCHQNSVAAYLPRSNGVIHWPCGRGRDRFHPLRIYGRKLRPVKNPPERARMPQDDLRVSTYHPARKRGRAGLLACKHTSPGS
jgi:hypothetical protein